MQKLSQTKLKAFSLLELIIVIGVFFILALIALPVAISQLQQSSTDSLLKDIKSIMFVTQQDAYTRKNNSAYGLAFYSDHYIVYEGNSLATATRQDSYPFTDSATISNISFAGSNELKFSLGSFKPVAGGSITISDSITSYRLNVSAQGLITYVKL